jgi:hypothetical protein
VKVIESFGSILPNACLSTSSVPCVVSPSVLALAEEPSGLDDDDEVAVEYREREAGALCGGTESEGVVMPSRRWSWTW